MFGFSQSQTEWARQATNLDPALGMILIVVGLIFALIGWRIFRVLVILDCAAFGALMAGGIGWSIAPSWPTLVVSAGLVGGVLLGALAVWMDKAGAVLCGGLAGAFVGAVVTSTISSSPDIQLVGAVIGLLIAVSLVFVVFQQVVIFAFALQGALMAIAGALPVVSTQSGFVRELGESAATKGWVIPFCVIAVSVIGVCVQMAAAREGGSSAR